MSTPLHNELAAALSGLREQQSRITEAMGTVAAATTTVASDDRLIEATVDGQGRLTGLAFTGRRWRDLAPKDLAARLVEVVAKAQDAAAAATAGVFAGLLPTGLMPDGIRLSSMDTVAAGLDALFDAAAKDTGRWSR